MKIIYIDIKVKLNSTIFKNVVDCKLILESWIDFSNYLDFYKQKSVQCTLIFKKNLATSHKGTLSSRFFTKKLYLLDDGIMIPYTYCEALYCQLTKSFI